MVNQVTPRLVCMKDPVTGERITVPANEAPAVGTVEPVQTRATIASPSAAPATHKVGKAAPLQAFNGDGAYVAMDRSYYRGQAGINTYSNTVSYADAIWFIEELSGADFNIFKTELKALAFDIKHQKQERDVQVADNGEEDDADGDEWVQITQRKTQIHRDVIEKCVRGCSNAHLATKAGRDSLYQKSVEELAALIISTSLLGKDSSDFLAE